MAQNSAFANIICYFCSYGKSQEKWWWFSKAHFVLPESSSNLHRFGLNTNTTTSLRCQLSSEDHPPKKIGWWWHHMALSEHSVNWISHTFGDILFHHCVVNKQLFSCWGSRPEFDRFDRGPLLWKFPDSLLAEKIMAPLVWKCWNFVAIWRYRGFQSMGVPPAIIHFRLGFSTINHPAMGVALCQETSI